MTGLSSRHKPISLRPAAATSGICHPHHPDFDCTPARTPYGGSSEYQTLHQPIPWLLAQAEPMYDHSHLR